MSEFISFSDHDPGGKVRLDVPDHVVSEAIYSPCRQYRYILHRRWGLGEPDRALMFLMLNPSTATEDVDDPTVRKCRNYANRWGYRHLIVGNIMAYRATDPGRLRAIDDPIGPDNHQYLRETIIAYQPLVICAWGCPPQQLVHVEHLTIDLLRELGVQPCVLRLNTAGSPGHPLYLAMDTTPQPWPIDELA